jgi:hypothetical protein
MYGRIKKSYALYTQRLRQQSNGKLNIYSLRFKDQAL